MTETAMIASTLLKSLLSTASQALEPFCEDGVECEMDEPATIDQVCRIEQELGSELPAELRSFFLTCSQRVWFNWYFGGTPTGLPTALADVRGGALDIRLAHQPICQVNWSGWEGRFKGGVTPSPSGRIKYRFEDLYPFTQDAGGNTLLIVLRGPNAGSVLAYGFEKTEMDCARLGTSLSGFLRTWATLGCPGPDVFDLPVFYDREADLLSLSKPESREWLRFLGIEVSDDEQMNG